MKLFIISSMFSLLKKNNEFSPRISNQTMYTILVVGMFWWVNENYKITLKWALIFYMNQNLVRISKRISYGFQNFLMGENQIEFFLFFYFNLFKIRIVLRKKTFLIMHKNYMHCRYQQNLGIKKQAEGD